RHFGATSTPAATQLCHPDACYCTLQGSLEIGPFDIRLCLFQSLLSAATSFLCTGLVNFLSLFGCISQDSDSVVRHFEEATCNEERLFGSTEFDAHFANRQG